MHCPTLEDLPASPSGKRGWPWTEASIPLSATMSNGQPWPRVSLVTPSYNQGEFIEETIRSVLLQGYPNLEYLIMDGGSSDGSVEIIRKYADWLAYWVSEPDRGQSEAINKGWVRSSGYIIGWLCSDDDLLPGALRQAVEFLSEHPDVLMVCGDCYETNAHGEVMGRMAGQDFDFIETLRTCVDPIWQPGSLMRRDVLDKVGWVDERLQANMDFDYFLRLGMVGTIAYLSVPLATYRLHANSKTVAQQKVQGDSHIRIYENLFGRENLPGEVLAMRKQALGKAYLVAAGYYYQVNLTRLTRQALARGLKFYPRHLTARLAIVCMVSCLGDRAAQWLKRVRHRARLVESTIGL